MFRPLSWRGWYSRQIATLDLLENSFLWLRTAVPIGLPTGSVKQRKDATLQIFG